MKSLAILRIYIPCQYQLQSQTYNLYSEAVLRDGSLWRGHLVTATQSMSYLHSGLSEVHPTCKIFSYKSIRVMCPLEDTLQGLKLAAVEGCSVSPLLSLLLLL